MPRIPSTALVLLALSGTTLVPATAAGAAPLEAARTSASSSCHTVLGSVAARTRAAERRYGFDWHAYTIAGTRYDSVRRAWNASTVRTTVLLATSRVVVGRPTVVVSRRIGIVTKTAAWTSTYPPSSPWVRRMAPRSASEVFAAAHGPADLLDRYAALPLTLRGGGTAGNAHWFTCAGGSVTLLVTVDGAGRLTFLRTFADPGWLGPLPQPLMRARIAYGPARITPPTR